MTFRLTALAALVMIFTAPTSVVRAQDHGHGDTVECQSRDMGRTRCRVPWNDARLVQQLSDTRCIRGENWGIDQRGLWVDRGCSGRFAASSGRHHSDHQDQAVYQDGRHDRNGWQPEPGWDSRFNVACQSQNFEYRFCAVDLGGAGRVTIARQMSDSACVEGRNWGANRAGVWVDQGCAAEFTVDRRWH